MCDFHSVIVTGDGRILHNESNSHSNIACSNNLPSGLDAKWWECEWDGKGEMPVCLVQTRGKDSAPTGVAERAAESHYKKLALIVAGELDPADVLPFNLPEYADVRRVYTEIMAEKQIETVYAPIETLMTETLSDLPDSVVVKIFRTLAESLSIEISEIAAEEIEAAEESGNESAYDSGYEAGQQSGYESASEDMYTQDYMDEQIKEAVEEAAQEAHEASYAEGFAAAIKGAKPAVEFINDLPVFLFSK